MKGTAMNLLLAGLTALFIEVSLMQTAAADTYIETTTTPMPTTTWVISRPYTVEHIVTSPVVIERPVTTTIEKVVEQPVIIERPVVIERPLVQEKPIIIKEKKSNKHLFHMHVFPLLRLNVL